MPQVTVQSPASVADQRCPRLDDRLQVATDDDIGGATKVAFASLFDHVGCEMQTRHLQLIAFGQPLADDRVGKSAHFEIGFALVDLLQPFKERLVVGPAMVVVPAKPADSNRRLIAKVRSSALDARSTRFSGFRISDTGFNRWSKR
jgi:hypothetical protein